MCCRPSALCGEPAWTSGLAIAPGQREAERGPRRRGRATTAAGDDVCSAARAAVARSAFLKARAQKGCSCPKRRPGTAARPRHRRARDRRAAANGTSLRPQKGPLSAGSANPNDGRALDEEEGHSAGAGRAAVAAGK